MSSKLHKHRVTLLPDGVKVSDFQPVSKRSKECYDSVSPCHIPKIKVCMNIQDDYEQMAIKIPTEVLDKIPMLKDFQQLVEDEDSDPVPGEPVANSNAARDSGSAALTGGGLLAANALGKASDRHKTNGSKLQASMASSADADAGCLSGALDPPTNGANHESNSAVLQLPGGSWGLLVMLKVLLDRHVDLNRVLLVDAIEPAGAAALAMAKYLGCDAVSAKIRQWLAGGLGRMCSDRSKSGGKRTIAWRQVLDALPDEEFSMKLSQPHQLMTSTAASVALPARLKVKWLRADCLSVLDLRAPQLKLKLPEWRSLVMCMSVVPGLKQLALRLPRGEAAQPQASPGAKSVNGARSEYLTGYICHQCDCDAYNQMTQAVNRGGPDFPFSVNIPSGVSATWQSRPICDRCRGQQLMDCSHLPRPRGHNATTASAASCRQGDVAAYVSGEAIVALLHASNILKNLHTLTLEDSPVAAADIGTFCDALVSFSGLIDLSIDAWKAQDGSTKPPTCYNVSTRCQVLDSLARLKLLQRLHIRDWINLAASDCKGGRVLGGLKCLEAITVGAPYPCTACAEGECVHFDDTLPFKAADA